MARQTAAIIDIRTIIGTALGFVLGLLLGWLAIGWWLWPVEWKDAAPHDLNQAYKMVYIRLVADSYALSGDEKLARERLQGWDEEELRRIIERLRAVVSAEEERRLKGLAALLEEAPPQPPTPLQPEARVSIARRLLLIFGVFLAVILLIVVWVGGFYLLKRLPEMRGIEVVEEPEPLGRFVANYSLGHDRFERSFDIKTPLGERLGACGVVISEIIGEGTPAKVTAFEVWLFDKNDIRTVTKVLMSEYAYNDDPLRTRLARKGDPVLAEPGKRMILEAATLKVEAEVLRMNYDEKASPPRSYFTDLKIELVVRAKERAD